MNLLDKINIMVEYLIKSVKILSGESLNSRWHTLCK